MKKLMGRGKPAVPPVFGYNPLSSASYAGTASRLAHKMLFAGKLRR